jgi:hypothetical protein
MDYPVINPDLRGEKPATEPRHGRSAELRTREIMNFVRCGRKLLWYILTSKLPVCCRITYSACSIHDGTLLHSKSQYTTVKHSRQLLEHTYMSDLHGLGTPTPIEFFQQDLLWQSSNTRSHSCSQKASKHTSGQYIVGLSVHLHTTTALRRIVHH